MSRRKFATVDAVLVVFCIVIFAGGVFAQGHSAGDSTRATIASNAGERQ